MVSTPSEKYESDWIIIPTIGKKHVPNHQPDNNNHGLLWSSYGNNNGYHYGYHYGYSYGYSYGLVITIGKTTNQLVITRSSRDLTSRSPRAPSKRSLGPPGARILLGTSRLRSPPRRFPFERNRGPSFMRGAEAQGGAPVRWQVKNTKN